jgi:hypothetical protein
MKLIKLFILILVLSVSLYAQNNLSEEVPRTNYVKFVMTAAIDTAFVTFNVSRKFDFVTVAAVCSTGVDSLQVWTLQNDGASWIQNAVLGLTDDTVRTSCILSTSRKEFIVLNPQVNQLMLISPSDDTSSDTVIVQGKYGKYK